MPEGSQRSGGRVGQYGNHHSHGRRKPGGYQVGDRNEQEHPEQEIHVLSPVLCMCATMYRIDLAHLCWSLENLRDEHPVNVIGVDDDTSKWSLVALERMLAVH